MSPSTECRVLSAELLPPPAFNSTFDIRHSTFNILRSAAAVYVPPSGRSPEGCSPLPLLPHGACKIFADARMRLRAPPPIEHEGVVLAGRLRGASHAGVAELKLGQG